MGLRAYPSPPYGDRPTVAPVRFARPVVQAITSAPKVVVVQELPPVEPLQGCVYCGRANRLHTRQCDGCGAPVMAPTTAAGRK